MRPDLFNPAYLRRDPYRDDSNIRPITTRRRVHQSAAKPDWHPDTAPGKPQLPKRDSTPARFLSRFWTNWFNPSINRIKRACEQLNWWRQNWLCSTRIQCCFITPSYNAAYLTNPPDFFLSLSFLSVSELIVYYKWCNVELFYIFFFFFFSSSFPLLTLPLYPTLTIAQLLPPAIGTRPSPGCVLDSLLGFWLVACSPILKYRESFTRSFLTLFFFSTIFLWFIL